MAYNFALVYWPVILFGLYTAVPSKFGNLYMDCFGVIRAAIVSYIAYKKDN